MHCSLQEGLTVFLEDFLSRRHGWPGSDPDKKFTPSPSLLATWRGRGLGRVQGWRQITLLRDDDGPAFRAFYDDTLVTPSAVR